MKRRSFIKHMLGGVAVAGMLPMSVDTASAKLTSLAKEIKLLDRDALWSRLRAEFILKKDLVHLNCGSLGSTPLSILDAVSGYMRELETNPVHQSWGPMGRLAESVRVSAASFIGAQTDEVALTRNTTEGMNAIANGLMLERGDEILTTNHEHEGGVSCWQHLRQRYGVRVVQVKMPVPVKNKVQIIELIQKRITPRTKVCTVSHVDTITGVRMPVSEIAAITRPLGIVLVCDGAQAPGMLRVDVKQLGVDAYASSSHKWMLAPKGCGLLYIRKGMQSRIRPISLRAGYGVYSGSAGTRNVPNILGHGLAMDFHNVIGRKQVELRCMDLTDTLRKRFARIDGLKMLSPAKGSLSSGMTTYSLSRGNSGQLVQDLESKHLVVIKGVPHTLALDGIVKSQNYNAIRLSTHIFNSESDIDRAARVIEAALKS